jgi:TetR/AcrR family transcriptional regulator, regulator of cefoperazone and chloramphenicol sensitivity
MRSASSDQHARARIRDAALALFGAHGVAATSMRAIADRAGVSAALVVHHYGSKEGLQKACDEHILTDLVGRNAATLDDPDLSGTIQAWIADLDTFRPAFDYLSRMVVDGSDEGLRLWDRLVERTQSMLDEGEATGAIRPSSDSRVRAIMIAAYGLVPLILERHLGRALGEGGLTAHAVARLTVPTLELYTHGLYADPAALQAARSALGNPSHPERTPPNDPRP